MSGRATEEAATTEEQVPKSNSVNDDADDMTAVVLTGALEINPQSPLMARAKVAGPVPLTKAQSESVPPGVCRFCGTDHRGLPDPETAEGVSEPERFFVGGYLEDRCFECCED